MTNLYKSTLDLAGRLTAIRQSTLSGYAETIVLIGDSITLKNAGGPGTLDDIVNFHQQARGFWTWANYYLAQRFWMVANKGVGSETSTNILARYASDAMGTPAGWVCLCAGANDIPLNVPAATIIANLQAMVSLTIGRMLLLLTIPPSIYYSTATQRATLAEVNAWIMAQASSRVVVADIWSAYQDPANNGAPKAGYTTDGIHPSSFGAQAMGWIIAQAVRAHTYDRQLEEVLGHATAPSVIVHDAFASVAGWTGYNGLTMSVAGGVLTGRLLAYTAAECNCSKVTAIASGLFAAGYIIQGSVYAKWRQVVPHVTTKMRHFPMFRIEMRNIDGSMYTYARSFGNASSDDTQIDPALLPTTGEGLLLTARVTIPATVDRLYPSLGWYGADSGTFEFSDLRVWKE